ncbi:MAG: hypothetical protein JWQ32_2018 [Marmoricola sp.]|nr:hypothetical protein [Marmoricola sp.]
MVRRIVQSRVVLALGVLIALAVPAMTLPRLPSISPWPLVAGLVPWIVCKYLLCPLRWRVLSTTFAHAPRDRRWYLRAFAESELLALLTPGGVGGDLWRVKRLTGAGVRRGDAVLSVGADLLVTGLAIGAFLPFAAASIPRSLLYSGAGIVAVAVSAVLLMRRKFPRLLPTGPLPRPRALILSLLLSAGYQLSIAGMLLGTVAATGHPLPPLAVLAAFGASELAAVVPGVNGASPRDGALVVALVAFGVPWLAAAAAITLRATLAWLPALTLGGLSLWLLRRRPVAAPA